MNLFDIIRLNVEFFFEDVEEIGSSDVSCCVNAVINDYAPLTEQYASTPTRREIRRAVNAAIGEFLPDSQLLRFTTKPQKDVLNLVKLKSKQIKVLNVNPSK